MPIAWEMRSPEIARAWAIPNVTGGYVVAADAVGAGVGEVVLYATGSSARQTVLTNNRPCDAVIMAIVDTWEVGGTEVWRK